MPRRPAVTLRRGIPLGLLEHLKKTTLISRSPKYAKVILVGLNWEALQLFEFFSKKFGPDQVLMIDPKDWNEDHFFYPGPCVDRGKVSEQLLRSLIPGILLEPGQVPLFYKDQKFRPFEGRARPHELKEGEVHFKLAPNFFDPKTLLDNSTPEKMALAQKSFFKGTIHKIELKGPTDPIKPAHFNILLSNGSHIESEYLCYGRSPREFLKLADKKNRLNKKFIKFSSQFEKNFSLVATFDFNSRIIDSTQTLFIPQNQTHNWGHFIVEVISFPNSQRQLIKAHCQMSPDQLGEEDVAKKLKLLKRTLQRLFTPFSTQKYQEKIYLLDYFPYCQIADDLNKSFQHFFYFGWNAPLEKEFLQENEIGIDSQVVFNNVRSLLSIKQIQEKFQNVL